MTETVERVARNLFLHDHPDLGPVFDRMAARGGVGDTAESQAMWDKAHSRAKAALNPRQYNTPGCHTPDPYVG